MLNFILHLLGFGSRQGLPSSPVYTEAAFGGDLSAGTLYRLLRPTRWAEAQT